MHTATTKVLIGIVQGTAKGYVNKIIKRFHEMGYEVQIFKLNAAYMDVPQVRERIFFIANNQNFPKLKLDFHHKLIPFGKVRSEKGKPIIGEKVRYYLEHMEPSDNALSDITRRLYGKHRCFNDRIDQDHRVASTLTASGVQIRGYDKTKCSDWDIINVSTFPQDYDFMGIPPKHPCGMSVPPNMMANIAREIWEQWLKNFDKND